MQISQIDHQSGAVMTEYFDLSMRLYDRMFSCCDQPRLFRLVQQLRDQSKICSAFRDGDAE